ncbi:MAG: hypothetical protein IMHGJWDQ_001061 [Candidatus Fervidibacter sp.]
MPPLLPAPCFTLLFLLERFFNSAPDTFWVKACLQVADDALFVNDHIGRDTFHTVKVRCLVFRIHQHEVGQAVLFYERLCYLERGFLRPNSDPNHYNTFILVSLPELLLQTRSLRVAGTSPVSEEVEHDHFASQVGEFHFALTVNGG